ncbi:VaFE repeat-containing surface-anchored protein, partial [Bacillus thuringiensis]|uniref:VaFE repeat-containing surface-anchored protein n=1 Tax=Bacillus thuringiensis TaxID=1428 RepID=UPI0016430BEB
QHLLKHPKPLPIHPHIHHQNQTLTFLNPSLKTTPTNKHHQKKQIHPKQSITIQHKIHYTNLLLPKPYTLKPNLINKPTNKPLLIHRKQLNPQTTFTP